MLLFLIFGVDARSSVFVFSRAKTGAEDERERICSRTSKSEPDTHAGERDKRLRLEVSILCSFAITCLRKVPVQPRWNNIYSRLRSIHDTLLGDITKVSYLKSAS